MPMDLDSGPPAKRTAGSPLSLPVDSVKRVARTRDNDQGPKLGNLPEELLEHIISYMGCWEVRGLVRVSRKFQRLATPRLHLPGPQLDDLPDDLLEKIIAEIRHQDVLHLVYVSSQFRRLAEKRLYSSCSFANDGSPESPNEDYEEWRRLCNLIRTLVERPDVAAYMHTVEFDHIEWRDEVWGGDDTWGRDLSEELWAKARDQIDIDEAYKETILSRQRPENLTSAATTLLLCLLPNLERLSFEAPMFHESDSSRVWRKKNNEEEKYDHPLTNLMKVVSNHPSWPRIEVNRLAAETAGSRIPLAKLRELVFTLYDGETEMNNNCLAFSAGIPSLREVRTFWMSSGSAEWPSTRTVNIEQATFLAHEPDMREMLGFFKACKALKSLAMEYRHPIFDSPENAAMLREAISLHTESLESLLIDEQDDYGTPQTKETHVIGSLKAFRRLKALSVPGQLLTGLSCNPEAHNNGAALIDTLPTSLEVLTINGSVKGDTALEEFLASLANPSSGGRVTLPNLRQVEMRPRIDHWAQREKCDNITYLYVPGQLLEQLRPVFASWGVRLLGPEGAIEDKNFLGGSGENGELYSYFPRTKLTG
ncbi:uncharacterized protein K452DRAFT_292523 [Aplosporella prunicola CBS 121167]|uniref:F-box domain-containing protein n=1 Tax=Aplosporella prunicola CBS 121167 TaxID=1176127 RepID=A0A6A6AZ48_9PEZI|nr:uncharacterized protein K452DRAFT_292523 [Aplosporella prunicola CBS 121167]KAF2136274.1 hypothetical protein K452DRAFT_292523 [Aplosporella prunicola CBS 121167]